MAERNGLIDLSSSKYSYFWIFYVSIYFNMSLLLFDTNKLYSGAMHKHTRYIYPSGIKKKRREDHLVFDV